MQALILLVEALVVESWNCRMVWIGKYVKDQVVSTSLPGTGTSSTRPGCSKTHPT